MNSMKMNVTDIMKTPVLTCSIHSDVWQVRDLMEIRGYSAIPVVDADGDRVKVKGMVTYHDLAAVMDDNVNIQQAMTCHILHVSPDTSIHDTAKMMLDKKVHHLVVMQGDEIVGMVSSLDFVKLVLDEVQV